VAIPRIALRGARGVAVAALGGCRVGPTIMPPHCREGGGAAGLGPTLGRFGGSPLPMRGGVCTTNPRLEQFGSGGVARQFRSRGGGRNCAPRAPFSPPCMPIATAATEVVAGGRYTDGMRSRRDSRAERPSAQTFWLFEDLFQASTRSTCSAGCIAPSSGQCQCDAVAAARDSVAWWWLPRHARLPAVCALARSLTPAPFARSGEPRAGHHRASARGRSELRFRRRANRGARGAGALRHPPLEVSAARRCSS